MLGRNSNILLIKINLIKLSQNHEMALAVASNYIDMHRPFEEMKLHFIKCDL